MSAALRLLVLMIIAASRLTVTGWTFHLQIIYVIVVLGTAYGLALGQSIFSSWLVAVFAVVGGFFVIPWQLGLTLGDGIPWLERLISLLGRLNIIIVQLIRQEPVQDSLLFLVLMSLLFWVLSILAAYNLTRYAHAWRAALPAGLAVVLMHAYDPRNRYGLLVLGMYFVLVLVLVAQVAYLRRRLHWKQNRVQTSSQTALELSQAAFVAALLLVLIAWTAPPITTPIPPLQQTWQKISQPWLVIRSRMSNMFVSLKSTLGVVTDFYGSAMALGLGNTHGNNVVMTVEAPSEPPPGARYYWRAWVYDQYESGRWESDLTDTQSATPDNFDLPFPELGGRWGATFKFSFKVSITTLYAASQPVWVSRPVRANLAFNDDGTADVAALHAQTPLFAGETYTTQSSLSAATVADLREAGTDYPAWVTDRYLQLPDEITPRTRDLAEEITAGLNNPYDKAQAITNYLRNNIEYSETISAPPLDQEPLDWFLFDYQKGFCNYYASAEIVLLRSLGIPARMAVGYARGTPQATGETELEQQFGELPATVIYEVRQGDAHAWPEVYFPGYGWVEFEPTAGQAPLQRPSGLEQPINNPANQTDTNRPTPTPASRPLEEEPDSETGASSAPATDARLMILSWAIIPALILFYIAWRTRPQNKPLPALMEAGLRRMGIQPPSALRRWAIRAAWSPLEQAYQEINSALARLGNRPHPADTPAERAAKLQKLLPAANRPIVELLGEYHLSAFGAQGGSVIVARQAAQAIRYLSWQQLLDRFLARFRRES
jgi:transglutaminase-like putative cysteine protease